MCTMKVCDQSRAVPSRWQCRRFISSGNFQRSVDDPGPRGLSFSSLLQLGVRVPGVRGMTGRPVL
jgi:hypothetical protein